MRIRNPRWHGVVKGKAQPSRNPRPPSMGMQQTVPLKLNLSVWNSFVMPDLIRHPEPHLTDKQLDSGFRRNDDNEYAEIITMIGYENSGTVGKGELEEIAEAGKAVSAWAIIFSPFFLNLSKKRLSFQIQRG